MKPATGRAACFALLLGGTYGCAGELYFLDAAGPAARRLAALGGPILITFVVITLIMWVLLVWGAVRRRGNLVDHLPYTEGGGKAWILIGGFAVPAVVLAIIFGFTLAAMRSLPLPHTRGDPLVLVSGHQWWWEVEYLTGGPPHGVTTANEIHVPVGQAVEIALVSRDVIHSFWVPKLHGKVDLIPGQTTRIRIEADRPGVYYGECAEYCGAQHARMRLLVIAHEPAEFARWLANERSPARPPVTPVTQHGYELFVQGPCALCHRVRGTPAQGRVAPDLTHIASRRTIAAGSLPNQTAYLKAWITHAQQFKPGAAMPNLTQFTGAELTALAAYLETLR